MSTKTSAKHRSLCSGLDLLTHPFAMELMSTGILLKAGSIRFTYNIISSLTLAWLWVVVWSAMFYRSSISFVMPPLPNVLKWYRSRHAPPITIGNYHDLLLWFERLKFLGRIFHILRQMYMLQLFSFYSLFHALFYRRALIKHLGFITQALYLTPPHPISDIWYWWCYAPWLSITNLLSWVKKAAGFLSLLYQTFAELFIDTYHLCFQSISWSLQIGTLRQVHCFSGMTGGVASVCSIAGKRTSETEHFLNFKEITSVFSIYI